MLPVYIVVGGLFAVIAYFAYGKDGNAAMAMANRFASVFLAAALGMSVEPADMTRNLSTLKMPRGVTLGMLIATSFPPVLGAEIKRVREAMKTRGAEYSRFPVIGKVYVFKFYRVHNTTVQTAPAAIPKINSTSDIHTVSFLYTVYGVFSSENPRVSTESDNVSEMFTSRITSGTRKAL